MASTRLPRLEFKIPSNMEFARERLLTGFDEQGINRYPQPLTRQPSFVLPERRRGKMSLHYSKVAGADLARYNNATMKDFLMTASIQLRAVIMGQNGDYAIPLA